MTTQRRWASCRRTATRASAAGPRRGSDPRSPGVPAGFYLSKPYNQHQLAAAPLRGSARPTHSVLTGCYLF